MPIIDTPSLTDAFTPAAFAAGAAITAHNDLDQVLADGLEALHFTPRGSAQTM